MKRYPHLIARLFYEPLVLTPQKHAAICQVLEAHSAVASPMLIAPPAPEEPDYDVFGETAVIPVHGILGQHLDNLEMASGGCNVATVSRMVDLASEDPSIERIIFDFRTSGGEVTGIPELARKIAAVDKETIGFTDSECCSGGVWLAAACQKFYATASSHVGSVGVWCAFLDLSRQMANEGANMQAISAGKHKLLGAYWKPLTDDEKAILQARVDKTFERFKAVVQSVRPVSEDVLGLALIYDGEEAASIGFTDGIVDDMDEILNGYV